MDRENPYKWRCVTESGAEYLLGPDGNKARYSKNYLGEGFAAWEVVDRSKIEKPADLYKHRAAVDTEKPRVGMALHCFSFSSWRLSTNVVSVEEIK
jgi:hypothetical protein